MTETPTDLSPYADRSSTYMFTLFIIVLFYIVFRVKKPRPVYLIDYCCTQEPDTNKTSLEMMRLYLQSDGNVNGNDIFFQSNLFLDDDESAGVGEDAYVHRAVPENGGLLSMQDSYEQAHKLIVVAVDRLLKKTGISPVQIDIVVTNCGMYSPTPSLASLMVDQFKLREEVKSFNLGGMGCSTGLLAVELAGDLLRVNKWARYALVASSEMLSCAGNALILSTWEEDKERAKMELMHVGRQSEDGVANLISPHIASHTLTKNIETLAIKVLPLGELCKAMWNKMPYMPNFKLAFQHLCIHPQGKAVIKGVAKGLGLSMYDMEPSLMALHRFGNTSCSGVWYILAYMEAKGRLKKGEKVWQIGHGSGFKCTTAVWKVIRDLECQANFVDNPWHDCINPLPHVQNTYLPQEVGGTTP